MLVKDINKEKLSEIKSVTKQLRQRVTEYRFSYKDEVMSTHVNAVEIAVGLVEIVLESETRAISKEEQNWFRAGYYLDHVFPSGSEWNDISTLYSQLVDLITEVNFFRG